MLNIYIKNRFPKKYFRKNYNLFFPFSLNTFFSSIWFSKSKSRLLCHHFWSEHERGLPFSYTPVGITVEPCQRPLRRFRNSNTRPYCLHDKKKKPLLSKVLNHIIKIVITRMCIKTGCFRKVFTYIKTNKYMNSRQ